MLSNILFLPAVFLLGIVTSYEDIKFGKIRNKWITLGIVWGLFALAVVSASSFLKVYDIGSIQHVGKVLLNFFLAIGVGFVMWKLNAWAAGDAKLFITYSLLIPLSFYGRSYLPLFPSFALLVNIFFVIFIYLFLAALVFFLKYLFSKLAINLKTKSGDSAGAPYDFSEFFLAFQPTSGRSGPLAMAKRYIRSLFNFHERKTGKKKIKIGQLQENMILGQRFMNAVFKEELERSKQEFGLLRQDGLTHKQVALIKKWAKERNIEEVKIFKTFPFAVWMFAGVLLTLLTKISVINLILNWLSRL